MVEPYPGRPQVQGHCPACGRESLFLGAEGHVTCAILACPNPCAADELLGGPLKPQIPDGTVGRCGHRCDEGTEWNDPDGPITPAVMVPPDQKEAYDRAAIAIVLDALGPDTRDGADRG